MSKVFKRIGTVEEVAETKITEKVEKEEIKKENILTEEQQRWWDHIKGMTVNYYGLPGQTVEKICSPMNITPDCIYIKPNGPAVGSMLTDLLNQDCETNSVGKSFPKFILHMTDSKLLILKPNPELLFKEYK